MVQRITIPLLFFLLSGACTAQETAVVKNRPAGSTTRSAGGKAGELDTAPRLLLDVLFATNEDCELFLNDEPQGNVSKAEFRFLKLAPGRYTWRAKSKSTGDEVKETFTVAAEGTNEVFMDVLLAVDENAAQRLAEKPKAGTQVQPAVVIDQRPNSTNIKSMKFETTRDAEVATINFLVTNTVLLKGGSFVMGNNKAPAADEVEHPVTVSPVYFGKYEVTQNQWENIMGYNPSLNQGCPSCPVENVSWEEVMKFVRKINSLSNKKFRLPTEAEWEYVARLGGKAEIDKEGGQEEYIRKTAWYFANSESKTQPVGRRQANAAGIFDLTGNVSEWCLDWYGTYYYKEAYNQKNPDGPPLGKEKIIRGGNFKEYIGDHFRPSYRNKRNPTSKSGEIGFRLVMEVND